MKKLSLREKSILAGLFLSKFNLEGLKFLGFDNFTEAFNVVGLALGVQPASVKNYRDEFDPLFPNERKGWHKREIRKYCKDVYDTFGSLSLIDFSKLLKDIIYKNYDLDILMEEIAKSEGEKESSFAKRLVTGQAAEQYFKDNFLSLDLFSDCSFEDTTKIGCGFDFKLVPEKKDFYFGIEVKGLNEQNGNIALTNKEYTVAKLLKDRYFIFLVKNFKEKPQHQIYKDPIEKLNFKKVEKNVLQINWNVAV